MRYELHMATKVPSLNEYLGWHYMKRQRYRVGTKKRPGGILQELWASLREQHKGQVVAINPAHVSITIYQRQRSHFMDDDNLRAGCKPLMDCLKGLGLIVDDAPEYLVNGRANYKQVAAGKVGAVVVVEG